jgi:hypothetical protein
MQNPFECCKLFIISVVFLVRYEGISKCACSRSGSGGSASGSRNPSGMLI